MKAVLSVVLAAMSVAVAHADWKDLKPGMDQSTVVKSIGTPLLQTRSRTISQTWTYDSGGYVMFEGGRAVYWEASKPAKPAPAPAAKPIIEAKTPRPMPITNVIAKA